MHIFAWPLPQQKKTGTELELCVGKRSMSFMARLVVYQHSNLFILMLTNHAHLMQVLRDKVSMHARRSGPSETAG